MCITYYRHFKCVEDLDRLPGQPIPQPSSGKWPYDNAPVSYWPAQGKNHSLLFLARCSHPSYPEYGGLGPSDSPMCVSSRILESHGADDGTVAEWFDEPCPNCNGMEMDRSVVMSLPVRTLDPTSFEPTDWNGVSARERDLIQRYADRLAELCAHSMGTMFVNEQRDRQKIMVDPYWDPVLKRTPANVSFTRLGVALRELTCDRNATHGPLLLPILVQETYNAHPWTGQRHACACQNFNWGPSGLPITLNGAVNSRRQMASLMLVTMDQNCALERWSADDIRQVTHAAQYHKDLAGPGFVPIDKFPEHGGLPPHAIVLTMGRALDVATAISRRRNLKLFAEELRANLTLGGAWGVHQYSHWEILLSRLLAEDSGISLRWARMILWRILADYWEAAQGFAPGFVFRGTLIFRSPRHQLAVLSETWRTNILTTRSARSEQEAQDQIAVLFDDYIQRRAFLQVSDNIAQQHRRLSHLLPFAGWLGGTPRATPDELLTLISKGEADCGICQEPLAEHHIKLPRQPAQCRAAGLNHWQGHECMMNWVKSRDRGRASCPLCRLPIGAPAWTFPTWTSNGLVGLKLWFPVPPPLNFLEMMKQSLGSDIERSKVDLYVLDEYQKHIWTPDREAEYELYLQTVTS